MFRGEGTPVAPRHPVCIRVHRVWAAIYYQICDFPTENLIIQIAPKTFPRHKLNNSMNTLCMTFGFQDNLLYIRAFEWMC